MTDANPRPQVNITIDRLVLKGFPAGMRAALTAAFQAELGRQAKVPGAWFGPSRAVAALSTPPRTTATHDARAIGAAAARQLIAGVRR